LDGIISESGGEIIAKYANSGDLGFGRDMHCLKRDSTHIACYVTNYFPKTPTLNFSSPDAADADAAVNADQAQLVATVAMEYSPIAEDDTEPVVKFYVYDEAGERVGAADLDGFGARPVPQLCMVCHGGTVQGSTTADGIARFRSTDDVKLGAKFLPFDLSAFTFSALPGFTKDDQQTAFRRLNEEIVLATNPGAAIEEMIDHMYAGLSTTQVEDFVIPGWDTDDVSRDFYKNVFAKSCRSCHIASTVQSDKVSGFPFRFRDKSDAVDRLGSIQALVCGAHVMPHSLVTYNRFWSSGQNNILEAFGNTFGSADNGWVSGQCATDRFADITSTGSLSSTIRPTTRQRAARTAAQSVTGMVASTSVDSLPFDRTFPQEIEPVLQKKCAWCHYANNPDRYVPADLNLQQGSSYDSLLTGDYVDPGDASNSDLYTVVSTAPAYMPKYCVGKYCLLPKEVDALVDWINAGATNVSLPTQTVP
jgi:hypothetical protein